MTKIANNTMQNNKPKPHTQAFITHRIYILFALCLCILFFMGCSANAYFKSDLDPYSSFDKSKIMAIFADDEKNTIEEKKLGIQLGRLMIDEGFKVLNFNIENKKAQCWIFLSANREAQQYTGSYTTYNTQYIYTGGYGFGISYVPPKTTTITTPQTHTYSGIQSFYTVALRLDCYEDNNLKRIWSGGFSANASDYDKYQKNALRYLIKLIGKDFKDYIDIGFSPEELESMRQRRK